MRRADRVFALSIAALLGLTVWLVWDRSDDALSAEGILEIKATLFNRPEGGPEVRTFVVPERRHAAVIALFQNATRDPSPARWQALGRLTIAYQGGATREIHLYWTRQPTGAFKIGRTYYRGSSDSAFLSTLAPPNE